MIVIIAILALMGLAFIVAAITNEAPLIVIQHWINNGR